MKEAARSAVGALEAALQALARRADLQPPGPLREALWARHARLARQLAAWPTAPDRAAASPGVTERLPGQTAWQALAAELCAARPSSPDAATAAPRLLQAQPREWAALRLERRLAEPLKPEAAGAAVGPLNPQALVPRALQRLRQLSPEYLQRLVTQLDALSLLAVEAPPPASAAPASPAVPPTAARASRAGGKARPAPRVR